MSSMFVLYGMKTYIAFLFIGIYHTLPRSITHHSSLHQEFFRFHHDRVTLPEVWVGRGERGGISRSVVPSSRRVEDSRTRKKKGAV
jgi:hypothetical protein